MGCKWDDQTNKVEGYQTYSLNGEAFIRLDIETGRWVALCPQAEFAEKEWNKNPDHGQTIKTVFTTVCIDWLKIYDNYGKNFLHRKENPSLSLLQKTFFSPVSCHATGFYPKRALMFWRKDGEEIHEDVEHGEILPNNDGTFQMIVYLNVSSIRPEDWRRYNCVFQLFGKEEETIQLDEAKITSNREKPSNTISPMTAAMIGSVLVSIAAAAGYVVYKKI
ncbi:PREDICTED: major histocompatibility complex class I-related gene protein-like [Cyprinodon variegatus]|uniref:major histocompatibility complex class I-related gene protein-like n=1 Tax=Cyprinodon variegatus TaxID=28743 RepID=UPI000742612F|nr:PREDICTED: major histocompatibility complex class I-related gene protein-like [Cyprinodon variegatus]